jgi:hypothetical protein
MKQAPPVQWDEIADYVGRRAAETVACPCCGSTSLSVRDVEYGPGHERGIQRYISCGWCGAFNGVNVKRAGELEKPVLQGAEEIEICCHNSAEAIATNEAADEIR